MKYQETKKQCQEKIDKLDNVCDRCGRKIVPVKTVDNANRPTYWAGCCHGSKSGCGHFTNGVKKEIYDLAVKLVLEDDIYLGMDKEEGSDFNYLFREGVSRVAGIIKNIERMKTSKPRYTKKQLLQNYNKYYK